MPFKNAPGWELKHTNERQGTLGHSKLTNHSGPELQCCRSQKVGFLKWCPFFDSNNF